MREEGLRHGRPLPGPKGPAVGPESCSQRVTQGCFAGEACEVRHSQLLGLNPALPHILAVVLPHAVAVTLHMAVVRAGMAARVGMGSARLCMYTAVVGQMVAEQDTAEVVDQCMAAAFGLSRVAAAQGMAVVDDPPGTVFDKNCLGSPLLAVGPARERRPRRCRMILQLRSGALG
jgi:hypothetical protein